MSFKKKSNILNWETDKVNDVPSEPGIYVLRSVPSLNGILYIGCSENMKKSLLRIFINNEIPEALWFDWYQLDSFLEAQNVQKPLVEKYTPKYNLS